MTIKSDDKIKGAVITSGKTSGFCAGADLGELNQRGAAAKEAPKSEEEKLKKQFEQSFTLNKSLRALRNVRQAGRGALEGLALGGGLEIRARVPLSRRRRQSEDQARPAGSERSACFPAPAARNVCRA